jgi:UDP-hydrolysing UDP-N-acetyl-D-glucosamine 2-epimerase
MKRIAVLCTARPSWSKLLPICEALQGDFELDVIAAAYAVTHNRSGVVDSMIVDGFPPTTMLAGALDGNTLETSALTTGFMLIRLTQHFQESKPDAVIVMADRHETAAGTIAAAYLGIPIVHCQGGEVSGNIDQKVRYLNTAMSDWHCVSNEAAYARVLNAGAFVDRVFITGCPSIDVCRQALADDTVTMGELDGYGTGLRVDPETPFTVVMMHPTTTHPETAEAEWRHALAVAQKVQKPIVVFWPGADAGMDAMAKAMRLMDIEARAKVVRTLPPRRFLKLLSQATYAVGNSSALVREASYFGLPRTLLGDRQRGREYSITPSDLYGDGFAAPRIADVCRRAVGR